MRRLLYTTFLVASFSTETQAQKNRHIAHNAFYAEANHAAHLGDHIKAAALFDSALAYAPWEATVYFDAILASVHAGHLPKAVELLITGARHGFDPVHWTDSALQVALDSPMAARYWNKKASLDSTYAASIDTVLLSEVMRMVDADQAVRKAEVPTEKMVHQDSLHFERMLAICEQRGFPTWRELGSKTGNWHLLLWHHRGASEYPHSRQWQQLLAHVHAAIRSGHLNPSYLCMFDDFSAFDAGLPQPWGTLLFYLSPQPDLIYLVDQETLNSNRASLGLGLIEWSAAQAGVDLSKVRFAAR